MTASEELANPSPSGQAPQSESADPRPQIDDAVILFRKIVDRMPTARWVMDAKALIETEPATDGARRHQANVKEELDELHADLQAMAMDWVTGWYARAGVYESKDGILADFRQLIESMAPNLANFQPGPGSTEISEDQRSELKQLIGPQAAGRAVIEMIQCAHLVASDAMRYGLVGNPSE